MRRDHVQAGGVWVRAALVGDSDGPSGWALSNAAGARRPVSLEALLCLEHKLKTDGNAEAAEDLHRQVTTLARIAEAWRRTDRDRHRHVEEAATP